MIEKDKKKDENTINPEKWYGEKKYKCSCGGNMRKVLNIGKLSIPIEELYECDKCKREEWKIVEDLPINQTYLNKFNKVGE